MARLILVGALVLAAAAAAAVTANRGSTGTARPLQVAGCINGHCT